MPTLGRFLSGQIVANTELQNKQDLPTVFGPCFSYNPHYVLFCLFFWQANSKAPKVEQVFLHATCNNHSFVVLFVDWSIMKLMLQFGKVQLYGLMRSIECSSQGVWVAEVPPNRMSGRISPMPPYVFGSMKWWQNHFGIITISIIWRKIIERRRKSRRKQWL